MPSSAPIKGAIGLADPPSKHTQAGALAASGDATEVGSAPLYVNADHVLELLGTALRVDVFIDREMHEQALIVYEQIEKLRLDRDSYRAQAGVEAEAKIEARKQVDDLKRQALSALSINDPSVDLITAIEELKADRVEESRRAKVDVDNLKRDYDAAIAERDALTLDRDRFKELNYEARAQRDDFEQRLSIESEALKKERGNHSVTHARWYDAKAAIADLDSKLAAEREEHAKTKEKWANLGTTHRRVAQEKHDLHAELETAKHQLAEARADRDDKIARIATAVENLRLANAARKEALHLLNRWWAWLCKTELGGVAKDTNRLLAASQHEEG